MWCNNPHKILAPVYQLGYSSVIFTGDILMNAGLPSEWSNLLYPMYSDDHLMAKLPTMQSSFTHWTTASCSFCWECSPAHLVNQACGLHGLKEHRLCELLSEALIDSIKATAYEIETSQHQSYHHLNKTHLIANYSTRLQLKQYH